MQGTIKQKIKNYIHKLQFQFASRKYGHPQQELILIGVTGTDGKTTVTSMIYHVLKNAGLPVGYISTVKAMIGDEELDTGLHVTTPDPWMVPKYLNMMKERGVKFAVIESTSSGLEQNRLYNLQFDSAVITNIGEDHLDYHGTWENYANAKFKLLEYVREKGVIVLNKDHEQSAKWLHDKVTSLKKEVFVKWVGLTDLKSVKQDITGISFNYFDTNFHIPVVGEHNFINSLQVINLCMRYTEIENIAKALKSFEAPEGRMQIIQQEPYAVIVDFAHTPGALRSALESVNLVSPTGKVITIFGCAGKRDKERRRMGAVSAELSDITILSAEDPRDEALFDVNTEIFGHTTEFNAKMIYRFPNHDDYKNSDIAAAKRAAHEELKTGVRPFFAFDEDNPNSRKDAIEFALKIADKGDVVFITGKGHERSLAFGKEEKEYPWSDVEVVKKLLAK